MSNPNEPSIASQTARRIALCSGGESELEPMVQDAINAACAAKDTQIAELLAYQKQHAGDCTFYSAMMNQRPYDGICTCGYGWEQLRNSGGLENDLLSEERRHADSVLEKWRRAIVSERDAEIARLREQIKHECEDWAHDDTKVKELAKPFIGECENDEYGDFLGVVEVVERLAKRLTQLEALLERVPHIGCSVGDCPRCAFEKLKNDKP